MQAIVSGQGWCAHSPDPTRTVDPPHCKELVLPKGRNSGEAKGHRYFECAEHHGLFVDARSVETTPAVSVFYETSLLL